MSFFDLLKNFTDPVCCIKYTGEYEYDHDCGATKENFVLILSTPHSEEISDLFIDCGYLLPQSC